MSKINVLIKVKELQEYYINSLYLKETVGGELPTGTLIYSQNPDNIDLSIDKFTISVVLNQVINYSMTAYVDNVINHGGTVEAKLTFVPKDFMTKAKIAKHKGIKNLVNSLAPNGITDADLGGKTNLASDTGLDGEDLYQNNETDFKVLNRFLTSYLRDMIYAHRWDTTFVSKIAKNLNKELTVKAFDKKLSLTVARNKFKELSPESEDMPVNGFSNVHYNNSNFSISTLFKKALENFDYNSNYYKALEDSVEFTFPDVQDIRAGHILKVISNLYENNVYLVISNELILTRDIENRIRFIAI